MCLFKVRLNLRQRHEAGRVTSPFGRCDRPILGIFPQAFGPEMQKLSLLLGPYLHRRDARSDIKRPALYSIYRMKLPSIARHICALFVVSVFLFGSARAQSRPALVVHHGNYFSWSAPEGWNESETMSGVSLIAPDQVTSVSSALLMRSTGHPTPAQFAGRMLRQVPGLTGLQLVGSSPLPNQPSGYGIPWHVEELELKYYMNGVPMRARWTVGILTVYNSFDAFMLGYQAPAPVFDEAKLWLAAVARNVQCVNPNAVAGNNAIILPKNNPLDNSGLIESWRRKGLSEDRISQERRAGTMGYERMKDASTGRLYDMPLESYDGTVGGYRNPVHPTQILQHATPGE